MKYFDPQRGDVWHTKRGVVRTVKKTYQDEQRDQKRVRYSRESSDGTFGAELKKFLADCDPICKDCGKNSRNESTRHCGVCGSCAQQFIDENDNCSDPRVAAVLDENTSHAS